MSERESGREGGRERDGVRERGRRREGGRSEEGGSKLHINSELQTVDYVLQAKALLQSYHQSILGVSAAPTHALPSVITKNKKVCLMKK